MAGRGDDVKEGGGGKNAVWFGSVSLPAGQHGDGFLRHGSCLLRDMAGLFSARPKRNHNSSGYRRLEAFATLQPEMAKLLILLGCCINYWY